MIISHKHKYLFVEMPRTGSTAVSKELRKHYAGESILKKHATYRDFLAEASAEERSYFTFSSVRNPVDKILSLYFKYKTDQRGYDNPEIYRKSNPWISRLMRTQFRYVTDNDATFSEFFRRFYFLPYDDWTSLDHARLDYVMRFENLSADFATALSRIGIEPVRPLPVANKTAGRSTDFWSYFDASIRGRAVWVFGPYFERWGYEFPEEWQAKVPAASGAVLGAVNGVRKLYWRHLR